MAPPTQERPKVMIPLPPLPEFFQTTTEGDTMAPQSSSSSSHAKGTARSRKKATKLVAAVEVKTTSGTKARPTETPLPPAKPLSFEAVVDARPTVTYTHTHSIPHSPVDLLTLPPPPPPPTFELVDEEGMAHRYSYRHHHEYKQPVKETKPTKVSQPQPARVINIPPPPPGFPGTFAEAEPTAQNTITICHVCRICLRPRSEKYHQEHPIPPSVVPPPPGICKRCRITSVEEKKDHVKVIHVEESNNVKLGLSAFLPQDNQYTRKEASEAIDKQHRRGYGEIYVRENSSDEEVPEKIVYRHVKRTVKSVPVAPSEDHTEVTAENLAAMNLMNDRTPPRPDTGRTTMKVNVGSGYLSPGAGTPQYLPQTVYVPETRKVERPDTHTSSSSRKSGRSDTNTTKNKGASSAKVSVSVKSKPSAAGGQVNTTAEAQAAVPVMPGFTESEIRTFARDEVERYRQAERMMDAHPNPYAHGRMVPVTPPVPVERRIEAVRDEAPSMPWKTPSSPPRETVFTTLQSRATSVASKNGPGRTESVPSEDQKYWYRPVEPSLTSTKSATSKDSTATILPPPSRHAASHDRRDTYEVDVTLINEHERRSEPLHRSMDGGPPTRTRLKEVVDTLREESSRRGYEPEIIEVSEKVESAPGRTADPTVSRRLRVVARDDAAQQQRSPNQSKEGGESRKTRDDYLLRTQQRHWHHGVVRTASGLSSPRHVMGNDSRAGGNEHRYERETDVAVVETEEVVSMPSPSKFSAKPGSHGRSDDASWYASRINAVRTHQEAPEHAREKKRLQKDEDDKTTWHPHEEPARTGASSRATMKDDKFDDDDWDWEYTKRIVTASDRPPGRIDDETAPGRHYVDTERLFRHRRPSDSDAREQESSVRSINQPRQPTQVLQDPRVTVSKGVEQDWRPDSGRESFMHTSDVPSQVRFASKVEFSSTPRRSDESVPEPGERGRSRPKSKGPLKGSGLKNQVDGVASESPESAEALVAEYETTHSSRSRFVEREEDLDYPWVFPASFSRGSARSGSAAQQSVRSEPKSFHIQESRRSTRSREDDDSTQAAPADEEELKSRRSARFSSRDDEETATQPKINQRLARAQSESPSREKLRQDYVYMQKQREGRSEALVSRGRPSERGESKVDDKGPYRELSPRTESMDALYGSGHGGPKKRQHEYVVREQW